MIKINLHSSSLIKRVVLQNKFSLAILLMYMKSILLTSALFILSPCLIAQEFIASVPLENLYVKKVQGCVLKDSIFISYSDAIQEEALFKTILILPDGSYKALNLPELKDRIFLGAAGFNDSLYFYYLKKIQKSIYIKTVVLSKSTGKRTSPNWQFELPEKILGTFTDNGLYVLYTEKNGQVVRLAHLKGCSIHQTTDYKLTRNPFSKSKPSVALIHDGANVTPAEAEARTKIYFTKKQILGSIDEGETFYSNPDGTDTHVNGKTTFFRMDSTGYNDTKLIPDNSGKKFSTFIYGGYLYKVVKDKGFQVSIYDWDVNDTFIKSFAINKQSSFKDETAYVRDDKARRLFNDRTVWEAMDNGGNPFITVHPIDSGNVILKIGTHTQVKSSSIPVVSGLGAVVTLISAAAVISNYALDKGESVDHYFYLKGNPITGFTYTNDTGILDQRLDLYEVFNVEKKQKPLEFKFKGYLKGGDFTYAIYQFAKGAKELKIIRFKN